MTLVNQYKTYRGLRKVVRGSSTSTTTSSTAQGSNENIPPRSGSSRAAQTSLPSTTSTSRSSSSSSLSRSWTQQPSAATSTASQGSWSQTVTPTPASTPNAPPPAPMKTAPENPPPAPSAARRASLRWMSPARSQALARPATRSLPITNSRRGVPLAQPSQQSQAEPSPHTPAHAHPPNLVNPPPSPPRHRPSRAEAPQLAAPPVPNRALLLNALANNPSAPASVVDPPQNLSTAASAATATTSATATVSSTATATRAPLGPPQPGRVTPISTSTRGNHDPPAESPQILSQRTFDEYMAATPRNGPRSSSMSIPARVTASSLAAADADIMLTPPPPSQHSQFPSATTIPATPAANATATATAATKSEPDSRDAIQDASANLAVSDEPHAQALASPEGVPLLRRFRPSIPTAGSLIGAASFASAFDVELELSPFKATPGPGEAASQRQPLEDMKPEPTETADPPTARPLVDELDAAVDDSHPFAGPAVKLERFADAEHEDAPPAKRGRSAAPPRRSGATPSASILSSAAPSRSGGLLTNNFKRMNLPTKGSGGRGRGSRFSRGGSSAQHWSLSRSGNGVSKKGRGRGSSSRSSSKWFNADGDESMDSALLELSMEFPDLSQTQPSPMPPPLLKRESTGASSVFSLAYEDELTAMAEDRTTQPDRRDEDADPGLSQDDPLYDETPAERPPMAHATPTLPTRPFDTPLATPKGTAWTDKELLGVLNKTFKHKEFRPGQLSCIKAALSGTSSLLVAPTGCGKSLVYQMVSALLPGFVLVVSPLISLMEDQVAHLPRSLPGALLSSSHGAAQTKKVVEKLLAGKLKVLFVSPERLLSEVFLDLLSGPALANSLSAVAVDEVHCLSQWSHNFRPAYLTMSNVIQTRLRAPRVLALTATATTATVRSICGAFGFDHRPMVEGGNVENVTMQRENLRLTVSRETGDAKKDALVAMLKTGPASRGSVIVYTTFRKEAETVADMLRARSIQAESYHAGMASRERGRLQRQFMNGTVRVIVATVAFGMGVDKADVRAVIHQSIPKSVEEYVQEVGRAGRDGDPAWCHTFLDAKSAARIESLAHSDGVEESTIRALLEALFAPILEKKRGAAKTVRENPYVALPIEETETEYDVKREVLETLMTYLGSAKPSPWIRVLPQASVKLRLGFYKSTASELARTNAVVNALLSGAGTKSQGRGGRWESSLVKLANALGWSMARVQGELSSLRAAGEISYEVSGLDLIAEVLSVPKDIESLAADLTSRMSFLVGIRCRKVKALWEVLQPVSVESVNSIMDVMKDGGVPEQSAAVHGALSMYFEAERGPAGAQGGTDIPASVSELAEASADYKVNLPAIKTEGDDDGADEAPAGGSKAEDTRLTLMRSDLRVLFHSHGGRIPHARAAARILHGLTSPAFPASEWGRMGGSVRSLWGAYVDVDFELVRRVAGQVLVEALNRGSTPSTLNPKTTTSS